jgi:putative membrane protein
VAAGAAAALVWPAAAFAHGDRVPVSELASSWHADPLVVVPLVLAAVLFARGWLRLRRRGRRDLASGWRALLFALGLLCVVAGLLTPLDAVSDKYLISAHMLQHVLIGDLAPALILLSLRGPLFFFFLPPAVLKRLSRVAPLRELVSFLLRPWISWGAWVVAILGWHIPSAYDFALRHQWAHDLEHVSFVVVGLLAWTQLIDPARQQRLTTGGRIVFAVGLLAMGHFSHDTLLSGTPLYNTYYHQDERLFGVSPLADQHLAGFFMLGEQTLTLGTAILVLYLLRRRAAEDPVPAVA